MQACVTGATGFVGGHVARALAERGDTVRVTFRDPARLGRLQAVAHEPVRADVLDRASLRRAFRGVDVVFHTAGYVNSRPRELVWAMNALSPRIVVEAAGAEDVRRVVLTSSVAAVGSAAADRVADEQHIYRGGPGLIYGDSKHEGELEAVAAGARAGVEVVVVNPAYVLGVPVDRSQPGETSTRIVGNFMLGRLPAVVDGATNIVDVEDVATGHLLAAERGSPGERYILGGYNMSWVELIDRLAVLSGERRPLLVIPVELAQLARLQDALGIPGPIAPEAFILMAQNWRYSSRKAKRELGYRTRALERTLGDTIDWYAQLIADGTLRSRARSVLALSSRWVRAMDRLGASAGLRAIETYVGRRLVTGA